MEINRLKSEDSQKKPSFILLLIPIINSGIISPIIKYYDKGSYSDWSITLTWILVGISLLCLGIYIKKMIEIGKLSKKYVLTLGAIFLIMFVISSYLIYQTYKPF